MTSIKDQKLLYHLTSINNLESILNNGLVARNQLPNFDDVAEPELIYLRTRNDLNKYVPFHFFAPTPFAGRVQLNHPDKEFIYICISRSFAEKNNFKIIPKHPGSMSSLNLYDYKDGIEIIDWQTMDRRDYKDKNCSHICMAECLSPITIQLKDFQSIKVRNEEVRDYVGGCWYEIFGSNPCYIDIEPHRFVD